MVGARAAVATGNARGSPRWWWRSRARNHRCGHGACAQASSAAQARWSRQGRFGRRVIVRALIGLGGNLGDVRERLDAAIAALDAMPGVAVVARSRFYRTPPWGHTEQPDFVNAAIAVETTLPALELLDVLLATERTF